MDKILIEGLVCQARIGVPPEERRKRQKILIDVEIGLDLKSAGRTDSFRRTVDYAAVSELVRHLAESKEFQLVEALAESAADEILHRFMPQEVRVRVRKFSVPGAESVGAEIFRKRI